MDITYYFKTNTLYEATNTSECLNPITEYKLSQSVQTILTNVENKNAPTQEVCAPRYFYQLVTTFN